MSDVLYAAYAAPEVRGAHSVAAFDDPDAVGAVEVIGDVAGVVNRAMRERFPFVKIN